MRQLLVMPTVKHVLSSTTNHFGFAFHVSWPWMLALLPINIAVNLYVVGAALAGTPAWDPTLIASLFLLTAVSTVAFASIAVSWHRYILLDEIPQGWARLRLDEVVWRYVGNSILSMLIMFAGLFVVGLGAALLTGIGAAAGGRTAASFIAILTFAALGIYAFPTMFRLMIKLPAVALGRRDYSFGQAWRDSAGNFWRLFGFLVIIFVIVAVLSGLAGLLSIPLNSLGTPGTSISLFVQLAVNWIGTIMGVTMLTSLYGIFYEGRAV